MPKKLHKWAKEDFLIALYVYMTLKEKMGIYATYTTINSEKTLPLLEDARDLINSLPIHLNNNPAPLDSLRTYVQAFASLDPQHETGGPYFTRKEIPEVWNRFSNNYEELNEVIEGLRRDAEQQNIPSDPFIVDPIEGKEGERLLRLHLAYEQKRDPKIVIAKKSKFLDQHGRFFCEACKFDFVEMYGVRGEGFIECHHIKPISELEGKSITKLEDLRLLCANCHRMVHYKRPWLEFEELTAMVKSKSESLGV